MWLENWFGWRDKPSFPEPIVWLDEERLTKNRPTVPAPPKVKPAPVATDKARDLLIAVKMLSRDTIDFLMFNDCGHTEEGLRERHMTLVEYIEELEG